LSIKYEENEAVNQMVRRCSALPLVNINEIDEVWETIFNDSPTSDNDCIRFLDYVVNTWVDDVDSLFHRSLWSHSENFGVRTNNHLEGWHNRLNRLIPRCHPNVFQLISIFQSEQQKRDVMMKRILEGNKPKAQSKKYRDA